MFFVRTTGNTTKVTFGCVTNLYLSMLQEFLNNDIIVENVLSLSDADGGIKNGSHEHDTSAVLAVFVF